MIAWRILLAVALAAVLPGMAAAQAYQCSVPPRLDPLPPVKRDGPVRRAAVGGYVLAASWSPEYCRADKSSMQCSGRNGRFGFVLHGLWPEARSGPPPQWCALTPRPSPELIRRNLCMTPVPWLLEHEWAKHGSCMARTPEAYFRTAATLWSARRWPDADQLSRRKNLTVGDLREAFVAMNPGFKADQIGVLTNRAGWLREIHICLKRDFKPRVCPRQTFGPPDSAPLKIWRGL